MECYGYVTEEEYEKRAEKAFQRVLEAGLQVTWIADMIGRSRGQVSNTLNRTRRADGRLMGGAETLDLIEQVLDLIAAGKIVPPERGYVRGRRRSGRVAA